MLRALCRGWLLLLCPLAFSCSSHRQLEAPELASINFIDQQGVSETISSSDRLKQYEQVDFCSPQPYKKVMRVFNRDALGVIRAYLTSYHPNGEVRQFLEVVDGRACGIYREWYANGQQKVQAYVLSGNADLDSAAQQSWLFNGCCQAWDEEGHLQAEIPYIKGQQEGVALYYHRNGVLAKKIPYSQHKIHGACQFFLEDGFLCCTANYCSGAKEGITQRLWENGMLAADEMYSNDRLMTGCYYDSCGKLRSSITEGNGFKALFGKKALSALQEYRRGIPEGAMELFSAHEELSRSYFVKNGAKDGEEIEYYPGSKQPKLSIMWADGRIQGVVKTWYPSGAPESKREMTGNKKNGFLSAWYADGSLMMLEEYDLDKLVKGEYFKRGDSFPVSTVVDGKGMATLFDAQGVFLRKVNYRFGKPDLDE